MLRNYRIKMIIKIDFDFYYYVISNIENIIKIIIRRSRKKY